MMLLRCITALVLSAYCISSMAESVSAKANGELLMGELDNDIAIYRGVPFAKAPINELRWQAPQPHTPRKGQQLATNFAPACMQSPRLVEWYKDLVKGFDQDPSVVQTPEFSEDCLHLNIWSPAQNKSKQLPVMVWIHGGSNSSGWSYEPNYLGHQLAKQEVIVVSIAYRVGVFGFFAHPELSQQQNINTNFGLLDQIAALQWIQQHINHFGGDANNITVFGESAGAANISYLMASPLAKGLFHRAIHQSAGFEMLGHKTRKADEQRGIALATELNTKNLKQLRAVDANALQTATDSVYQDHGFAPVIDGHVLTEEPIKTFATQQQHPVSLMIGTNANEWYMYLDTDTDAKAVESYIEDNASDEAQQPLKQWASQQSDHQLALDRLYSAREMLCPSIYIAKQVAAKQSSWVYYFSKERAGKAAATLKAYHGAEIPYAFDTHDEWLPTDNSDTALSQTMLRYWSNFAKTGNPNRQGLPNWPNYNPNYTANPSSTSVMELGDNIGPIAMPEALLCQWLSPIPPNQ